MRAKFSACRNLVNKKTIPDLLTKRLVAMAFDFFHSLQVAETIKTVKHLKKSAGIPNSFAAQKSDIQALQLEVGVLRLQVAVLYQLLQTKGLFTQAEIQKVLESLDLADGKADGQFDGDPISGRSIADPSEEPV
jgi:hypothetical protein